MLRAVVLGCGAIGAGDGAPPHPDIGVGTHAGAYVACAETVLAGVADADPERARVVASRLGAGHHAGDVATLLAEAEPELVSVCTPDATHAAVLETALRAPSVRGVLAEKPLAGGAAEAAALAALAQERGVVLAVNYSRRYAPPVVAAARAVAAGAIGAIQHVHGTYGKGLRHNGTHWVDLLRMVTAGDPETARGWDRLGEGGPDASLEAELLLPGGASARLAALDHDAFTAFELEVTGVAGRVRFADGARTIERWTVGDDPRHPGYRILVPGGEPRRAALRDAALHAVEDLARAVRTGTPPACTAADGVRALELAEAIARSAAQGGAAVPCVPQPPSAVRR